MIQVACECGAEVLLDEAKANSVVICRCGKGLRFVSAEELPAGAGLGDFDSEFLIQSGPVNAGCRIVLGGVKDIEIGKLQGKHINLVGPKVSRNHCKLTRVDFGPSRWKIEDQGSTNGLFINQQRVTNQELQSGDVVQIGEYALRYQAAAPKPATQGTAPASILEVPVAAGGPVCPSCGRNMAPGAKICVGCGIYIPSGRPLVTRHELDENALYTNAENVIRAVSFFIWFGLYPVASEARGQSKPRTIWITAAATIAISLVVIVMGWMPRQRSMPAANLALWVGSRDNFTLPDFDGKRLPPELVKALMEMQDELTSNNQYHWYQLFTHAVLHGGILHLAGNMLFLLVFGTGVNSLIGNLRTAIVYPILAVAAGLAYMIASRHAPLHPMVGASGAIMGLAGMYLVFFPVHRVYMSIWMRLGLLFGFRLWWKLWPVRGFWVVLFFISFDILFTMLGVHDNVAHWAHLGGFLAGIAVALILLLTRQVDAHKGNLLSVILGKYAWPLIGKPVAA